MYWLRPYLAKLFILAKRGGDAKCSGKARRAEIVRLEDFGWQAMPRGSNLC